jgi:hypothetical protein
MGLSVLSVARRFAKDEPKTKDETKGEAKKAKLRRMVVMMGPPAAGKGFFTGEPEADKPGSKYGWKFPDSTHGLFTSDDIPDHPEYDESDNHLRAIQRGEAKKHYETLKAAHAQGQQAFDKALEDHWYETKDGSRVGLGDVAKFEDFNPEEFGDFFKKANKDFYVSMRGWHDDHKKINPTTGKQTERYKDQARHLFDDSVGEKIDQDKDLLIVDSAGEDIDAQDFQGQIDRAKANGYEVTVVFLHPEQADTELSNLARGKVQGKRMVDQADISNWYAKNKEALEGIAKANPDNFLHYRKPPPDPDPKKAAEKRARARELMEKLPSVPVQRNGESGDDFKARRKEWEGKNKEALDEIGHTLYKAAPYPKDPEKSTSWGRTLDHARVPEKPEGDLAESVQKMNEDAESRAGAGKPKDKGDKPAKGEDEGKPKEKGKDDEGGEKKPPKKDEPKKTQQDFLRAMGDKVVSNPNPDARKKQIKLRSLPWEHQKKYYEQWAKKHAHQQVMRSIFRVASRYEHRVTMAAEEKDWLASWMSDVAKEVREKLKVDDYEVEVKSPKGPVFFAVVKGAEGDTKAIKAIRPTLEKLADSAVKKHPDMGKDFEVEVHASNKGDDLYFEVEVIFP